MPKPIKLPFSLSNTNNIYSATITILGSFEAAKNYGTKWIAE